MRSLILLLGRFTPALACAFMSAALAQGLAPSATLNGPSGIVFDASGNYYFTEYGSSRVRKVSPAGLISTVAGTGVIGFSGDNGPATSATLSGPTGIAIDGVGNLYVADSLNRRVRRIDTGGTITTVAGNGVEGYSGDNGPATAASLRNPRALAVDSVGNLLIADLGDHRVRKVAGGVITTVAGTGNGTNGTSGDGGPATAAQIPSPIGLASDGAGGFYVLEFAKVRHVSAGGTISAFAGGLGGFDSGDGGPATAANFFIASSLARDAAGNVYVGSYIRVRKISGGTVATIAGSEFTPAFAGDGGPATSARVATVAGIAFDSAGNIFLADSGNDRVRRIDSTGVITTVAGGGASSQAATINRYAGGGAGDNGQATTALLESPAGLVGDPAGNLLIGATYPKLTGMRRVSGGTITSLQGTESGVTRAINASFATFDAAGNMYFTRSANDLSAVQIRKRDPAGVVTVYAGQFNGFNDNVPPQNAAFTQPGAVAMDSAGNLFVADGTRVRKIAGNLVTTVAGNGSSGDAGDNGPGTSALLGVVVALVPDNAGGVYLLQLGVADASNRVRHVSAAGVITAVPGTAGTPACSMARDAGGNFYLSHHNADRIDRVAPDGTRTVFAGGGSGGDGSAAASAALEFPCGLAFIGGELHFVDGLKVRKVDAGGVVRAVAGIGYTMFVGDGLDARDAGLMCAAHTSVGQDGALYIADSYAHTVRRVSTAGIITTVAGKGAGTSSVGSFDGDGGPAVEASLNGPASVVRASDGTIYIADRLNHRIRKVDAGGVITTVAGNGTAGSAPDGASAVASSITSPGDMALDSSGSLYFIEPSRVRRIDSAGKLVTVAGSGQGSTGFGAGDGGPATAAPISPVGIAIDGSGNLYIAEYASVRKVTPGGIITSVAGGGGTGRDGDPATSASLFGVTDVAVDDDNNLFIASALQNRVRVVDNAGVIRTLSGSGAFEYSGDGGATASAGHKSPAAVSVDNAGGVFISDPVDSCSTSFSLQNGRVRKVATLDATPSAFGFLSQASVAASGLVQSAPLVPTGFNTGTLVSIVGGEYSIGCSGTFTSSQGVISPGDSICVRHNAATAANADIVTTLTIGGRSGTFTSTTATAPGSLGLSATSFDFGAQSMRTDSAPRTITLTNTGATAVTLNALKPSPDFTATHNCGTLAPNATCQVQVTFVPLSEGAINGSLVLQASPGNQAVTLTGSSEKSLVLHYYRSILRREPDAAGKAFWEAEAARATGLGASINEAWFAMAVSFYTSPEYAAFNRSDAAYLTDLYETFFNRAPDASGLAYWQGQLTQGMPREVALAAFLFSGEFVNFNFAIFGVSLARAEVDVVMDFYRGLLGRFPEDTGFQFWTQKFRTAQCGGATAVRSEAESISSQFATGTEYAARNRTVAQYVGDLYNAFLRRGGDLNGVQFWISQITTGAQTREQVRVKFVESLEFSARVNRMAAQGCQP